MSQKSQNFVLLLGSVTLFFSVLGISQKTWAADAAKGKEVYTRLCVSCHGASGKGDGAAAAALNPKPRDLSEAKSKGDDYLKNVIEKGGAANGLAPSMPAWGAALQPGDLDNLIAYIKTL